MLFALGHGQKFVQLGAGLDVPARTSEVAPPSATALIRPEPVAGSQLAAEPVAATTPTNRFGYMFSGGGLVPDPEAFDKLGRVGAAMVDSGPFPGPAAGLPAILTYFGQFIDHDITANTDRNPALLPSFSIADPAALTVNDRQDVIAQLGNLRQGSLRLDSVYGDGTDIDTMLRQGAHMRIGRTEGGAPNDLPRFGQALDEGVLPADLLAQLLPGIPLAQARKFAFIGDSRNDENLVVAQLHLAFLRFHNAIADTLAGSDEARFADARRLVQWHYQWLVVERYLAAVCDPAVLGAVKASSAARYRNFAADNGGVDGGRAPLPLEFSVAAFRFGHSMIRARYVFNANFPAAELDQLFEFTGKGGLAGFERLLDVWIIDWRNFIGSADAAKLARPLDPELAVPLGNLRNEDPPHLRSLAQRNLRRSYVLNLSTAQVVGALLDDDGLDVQALTNAEITAGPGGTALHDNGYETQTPLWFYILAEATARGGGQRLGPVGSVIVAETLLGLIATDSESYWNAAGSDNGRWHPTDAALVAGSVDSFEALFAFAGVL